MTPTKRAFMADDANYSTTPYEERRDAPENGSDERLQRTHDKVHSEEHIRYPHLHFRRPILISLCLTRSPIDKLAHSGNAQSRYGGMSWTSRSTVTLCATEMRYHTRTEPIQARYGRLFIACV